MDTHSPRIETGSPPSHPIVKRSIVIGFLIAATPWVPAFGLRHGYDGIPYALFACFGMPVIASGLAIIRKTRPYGLGMLIACGLGWLILGAICGGLFR